MTDITDWDPHTDLLEHEEQKYEQYMNGTPNIPRQIFSIASSNQADTFEQDLRQISSVLTTEGQYEKVMSAAAATSKFWKWKITPEKLAKLWAISIDAAAKTIQCSTQRVSHDSVRPLHRRYRTKQQALRYDYLDTVCYTDTMCFKNKVAPRKHMWTNVCPGEKNYKILSTT